ncbi:helix-turn-helix domain-containing protein [Bacillus salipaludis]|uniref:helix-turn-helix domain-containing protein n=1 Tax=Bacillus salipaludis TaxID=2547811 RepID=UPI002E1DAE3D|nr:helix-turn-helix domain-containing protein [Bacillus salipaludis]
MKNTVLLVMDDIEVIQLIRDIIAEYDFPFVIDVCNSKDYLEMRLSFDIYPAVTVIDFDCFLKDEKQQILDHLKYSQSESRIVIVKDQYRDEEMRSYFKNGAIDCLKKPLHKEMVCGLFHEFKKQWHHRGTETKDDIQGFMSSLRISLAYDLLYGNIRQSREIWDKSKLVGMSSLPNTVMVIQIDNFFALTKDKNKQRQNSIRNDIIISIRNFLITKLDEMLVIGTAVDKIAVLLSIPVQKSEIAYKEFAKSHAENLKAHIKANIGYTLTIGIGNYYEDARNVANSYQEALHAQKYKFFSGNDSVIHINDVKPFSNDVELLPNVDVMSITSKLSMGDFTGVKQSIEDLLRTWLDQKNIDPEAFRLRILELLTTFVRAAVNAGAETKEIFSMNLQYATQLNTIDSLAEMKNWFEEVVDHFLEQVWVNHNEHTLQSVQQAIQYIERFAFKPITLEQVSNHVHLSPNYFSSIFKSTTGSSFVEYITLLRMEKAKAMLQDLNYTVYHIAHEVGYGNPRYFCRVFKMNVGKTPSQYRNSTVQSHLNSCN